MPCGKIQEEMDDRRGGNSLIRAYNFFNAPRIILLSDRRITKPYGLEGGKPGKPGRSRMRQNGVEKGVAGKCSFQVLAGDALIIETPGGGGYGTT
jgi:N-methylhydantoinase B/oxoprolinase/acetone carboxylase alpha subunit